jgi:sugar (pentulose or hexulose) kinase
MIARARLRRNPPSRARWHRSVIAFALGAGLSALSAAQSPPASEPSTGGGSETAASRSRIALVLPLESDTYAQAAEAVKAGFLAAAATAQAKPLIIGHGDGDVVRAFA